MNQEQQTFTADEIRAGHREMGVPFHQAEGDLPEPPDNFDLWNSFPEHFRDKVTNQFTRGITNEYDLMRDRIQAEYATARARQTERQTRQANARPRQNRGRR